LSEKLEALIKKYKDDWEQLCLKLKELTEKELTEEVKSGRKETEDGVTRQEALFYEQIARVSFGDDKAPDIHRERLQQLVRDIIGILQETIGIGERLKSRNGSVIFRVRWASILRMYG
jgi:hypothetical protein